MIYGKYIDKLNRKHASPGTDDTLPNINDENHNDPEDIRNENDPYGGAFHFLGRILYEIKRDHPKTFWSLLIGIPLLFLAYFSIQTLIDWRNANLEKRRQDLEYCANLVNNNIFTAYCEELSPVYTGESIQKIPKDD